MATKLTAKQELFVQGLVSGLSQREAYRRAYPNATKWKDNAIDSNASTLLKNTKVSQRYQELMGEHKKKALWTREKAVEKLLFILQVAEDEMNDVGLEPAVKGAYIDAIKELNKLESVYDEQQARVEGIRANTELTKLKSKLIKGAEHDFTLMNKLIEVLGDG
ncbi:terminase small subunit [Atopococcus tabaci]|uniref:terminase small subunit n=1 Tax=Atopococcus tabaci TaxID=269774 RepID=UPI002409C41D|nr:terminase small subunit [Atopococcus tabaci]